MKNTVFLLFFAITCCKTAQTLPSSFYEKVVEEKSVFKDFLKRESLIGLLKTMDNEFQNTDKIIMISFSNEIRSAFFIYDCTNDNYYFAQQYLGYFNYSYKKIPNREYAGETNLFVLKYVLDDDIEQLQKISEQAFEGGLGSFYQTIYVIDTKNRNYIFERFKSFDVYKGKPVMSEEEFNLFMSGK